MSSSPSSSSSQPLISLSERFEKAADILQNLPQSNNNSSTAATNDEKLRFYALFKQSTQGPCTTQKPGFWDVVARAKWDAWYDLGDMPMEEAMEEYIAQVVRFLERFTDSPTALEYIEQLQKENTCKQYSSSGAKETEKGEQEEVEEGVPVVNDSNSDGIAAPGQRSSPVKPLVVRRSQQLDGSLLDSTAIYRHEIFGSSKNSTAVSTNQRLARLEDQVQLIQQKINRIERERAFRRQRLPWIAVLFAVIYLMRRFGPLVKQLLFG